jgi:hypothetical protein
MPAEAVFIHRRPISTTDTDTPRASKARNAGLFAGKPIGTELA